MNFINENYVWLIIAGVVLLMAFIGYLAEKTDFGRKEKEVKPKKEKKIEKIEPMVTEVPVAEEEVIEERPFEQPTMMETPMVEEMPEMGIVDLMTTEPINEEMPLIGESIIEEIPEAEELPMAEEVTVEEALPMVEVANDDIKELDEVVSDEPISLGMHEDIKDINIPLPELDSLKENNEITADDESEVWKF